MSLTSLVRNLLKRGAKDISNRKKIMNYLDGDNIKEEGLLLSEKQIVPYAEQLVARINNPICSQCVKKGYCIVCGCDMPLAMMIPEFECEGGHFKEMVLPKEI